MVAPLSMFMICDFRNYVNWWYNDKLYVSFLFLVSKWKLSYGAVDNSYNDKMEREECGIEPMERKHLRKDDGYKGREEKSKPQGKIISLTLKCFVLLWP